MKKITLLILLATILSVGTVSANTTVGAFQSSYFYGTYLTGSIDKFELQVNVSSLLTSTLNASIDYNVFWKNFSIAKFDNFFCNVAVGADVTLYNDFIGLAAIVPGEFGYKFPIVASGLDVYFQVTPLVYVVPSFNFDWYTGVGVRVNL